MRHTTRFLILGAALTLATVGCNADIKGPTVVGPIVPVTGSSCMDTAVFRKAESSPYGLPYEVGESNLLSQTYCNATGSHRNQLAYDFVMPFGAPILASRPGVVVDARDDFPDDGVHSQNFNLVIIEHTDGTAGIYAHLRQGSLRVAVGDHVQRGEQFADAGSSGTGLPCAKPCAVLHFQVSKTRHWRMLDDIGVNFRNAEGPRDERNGLMAGSSYLAFEWPG